MLGRSCSFLNLLSQNHSDHIKHITYTEWKGTLQLEGKIFKVLKPHSTCLYRKLVLFKKNLERHKHILQFVPISLKALNKISKILQQTCNISLHFSPSFFHILSGTLLGLHSFFSLSVLTPFSLSGFVKVPSICLINADIQYLFHLKENRRQFQHLCSSWIIKVVICSWGKQTAKFTARCLHNMPAVN